MKAVIFIGSSVVLNFQGVLFQIGVTPERKLFDSSFFKVLAASICCVPSAKHQWAGLPTATLGSLPWCVNSCANFLLECRNHFLGLHFFVN